MRTVSPLAPVPVIVIPQPWKSMHAQYTRQAKKVCPYARNTEKKGAKKETKVDERE